MYAASLIVYCKKENSLPLLLKERRQIARLLYSDMYTALARSVHRFCYIFRTSRILNILVSGDSSGLRRLCADGLSKNLINQIDSRPKNQKVSWKLVQWLRGPSTYFTGIRVMSDRATQLPELANSGIRQIVLRLTSQQSMNKVIPSRLSRERSGPSETVEPPAKEQSCEEYVVIQEIRWNGNSTGWRIWGYTKPTNLDTLNSDPYFAPGMSPIERIEAMKRSMGGGDS